MGVPRLGWGWGCGWEQAQGCGWAKRGRECRACGVSPLSRQWAKRRRETSWAAAEGIGVPCGTVLRASKGGRRAMPAALGGAGRER